MRGDARVFVRFDNVLTGTVAGRFLNETAQAARVAALAESPLGQETVEGGITIVRENGKDLMEAYKTWQQHASAWWLMNSSGMTRRTSPPRAKFAPST